MLTHFANIEPFLLLNKNYASYNKILCNEFGLFCCMIITQFHIFTNTINRSTLTKKSLTSLIIRPWQPLWAYGRNAYKFAVIDFLGEHSPTEIVSKIRKLYDYYVAKYSKIIWQNIPNSFAYCLIFIGCIVFIQ